MAESAPNKLRPEPPPTVLALFHQRLGAHELQTMRALFALRRTAQQVDNAVTDWLSDVGGSIARFQVMSILWASENAGVPHKEIVATLGVTRATVSGLITGLERDGLVQSVVDPVDRRNQNASLTSKARAMMDGALEVNVARLQTAFGALSDQEMTTFTDLLARIGQGFAEAVKT